MRTAETGRYSAFDVAGPREAPIIFAVPSGPGFSRKTLEPWLAPLAGEFRVVAVDLPGSGEASFDDDNDYSYDAFVRDLESLRTLLGSDHCALLGHGWGATLAVEYALQHPARVSALILVSPLRVFNAGGQDVEAQARMVEKVDQTLIPRWTSDLQGPFLAALQGDSAWDQVETHPWWGEMIRTQFASPPPARWDQALADQKWGLRAYASYKGAAMFDPSSAMAHYDLAQRMTGLRPDLPVLVLSSDHDANYVATASLHAAPIAAAHAGATVINWSDVGHFPFVERTQDFARIVQEFLKR